MSARIIDGKVIAARIRGQLAKDAHQLALQGRRPGLAVILVGEDAASQVYVRNKAWACEEAGIAIAVHRLPAETSEAEVLAHVAQVNADPDWDGLIVQLPLPPHIDPGRVIAAVDPEKDVDGFHALNAGHLLNGEEGLVPCTPLGILRLLAENGLEVAGRHAVVVGRGHVGRPLAVMLMHAHATVTVCHSRTYGLTEITRMADILVAAVGRPQLISADMVKPGAVVIDVGIHRLPEGGLCGDVDFDKVRGVAGWITPVPGGVGPMTVAMLLHNTLKAARAARHGSPP